MKSFTGSVNTDYFGTAKIQGDEHWEFLDQTPEIERKKVGKWEEKRGSDT